MNSYGLPKGHRPVRLPTSYGPGPLVGITLWPHAYGRSSYLRVVWSRGCKIPYVYLKGSVRFTCEHPKGTLWIPYGHWNIRTFSFAGTVRSRADAVRAWKYLCDQWCRSFNTGSGEARECTLGLYLPSQTRLCDI